MELCVNKKKTEQVLGYGIWLIITTLLVVPWGASMIEASNTYVVESEYSSDSWICTDSVLSHDPKANSLLWDSKLCDSTMLYFQMSVVFFSILNIINFVLWASVINEKQSKFNIMWCENKTSNKIKSLIDDSI